MTSNVYAIVLAAGSATRFGSTKQLAKVGGRTLVVNAIEAAAGACGEQVLVVLGHESSGIASSCTGLPGFVTVNDAFTAGIGSSIALAVDRVRHVADAIVITLADQPLVTAEHLKALIDAWDGGDHSIVATTFGATKGPPVLFASGCFDDLALLRGDNGGRRLLSDSRFILRTVRFEPAVIDIDAPDDLRRI